MKFTTPKRKFPAKNIYKKRKLVLLPANWVPKAPLNDDDDDDDDDSFVWGKGMNFSTARILSSTFSKAIIYALEEKRSTRHRMCIYVHL